MRITTSQKVPEEYEEKLISFQLSVIPLRKTHSHRLSQTGNADQTLIWFDMPESITMKHAGERSVQVRMTSANKQ
jgi:hypothetical protein